MSNLIVVLSAVTAAAVAVVGTDATPISEVVSVQKLTPIILVEEVEPCLEFWEDRLGFERTMEVPREGAVGFTAVQHGSVEIMYQSRVSIRDDVPRSSFIHPAGPSSDLPRESNRMSEPTTDSPMDAM